MSIVALVIAFALVAVAGALVARADWAAAPRGRSAVLERFWVILPAAFLVTLMALAARAALS